MLAACNPEVEIPSDELDILKNDTIARVQDDVIRIMSVNVLVHIASWGGEPVQPRAKRFSLAVKQYMPDVIGAQEFCRDWYSILMPLIEDSGYKVIKERYKLFRENRSPIIYNANVLDLVDHGIHLYSEGDNNGCRVVSWAVFKRKSDDEVFAVTSTHFDLIRTGKEEAQLKVMLNQADEFFSQIDMLTEKYNCPIFMCGDYNSSKSTEEDDIFAASEVYDKLQKKYIDVKYASDILKYDKGGGAFPDGAWDEPVVDHIFMTGDAIVSAFAILSSVFFQSYEDGTHRVSDHLPIFADFLLGS